MGRISIDCNFSFFFQVFKLIKNTRNVWKGLVKKKEKEKQVGVVMVWTVMDHERGGL